METIRRLGAERPDVSLVFVAMQKNVAGDDAEIRGFAARQALWAGSAPPDVCRGCSAYRRVF